MKKLILIMFVFLIVSCSDKTKDATKDVAKDVSSDETKDEKRVIDGLVGDCKQRDHQGADCDKSGKYDKKWRKKQLEELKKSPFGAMMLMDERKDK